MNTLVRSGLIIGAALLFVACGGSQLPISAPGAMPQASALTARANNAKYKVVYSFGAARDGADPRASLINVGGTLYGTTSGGGSYTQCDVDGFEGCGTVFSLAPDGTEKVLYSFSAEPDGANPVASLIEVNGTLYGTTFIGGSGNGTVFSIRTSGEEHVLYSFPGGAGGYWPSGALIRVKGRLYGTTQRGGARRGTVFSITTSGTEKVVHRFTNFRQGAAPVGALVGVGGMLYGTTADQGVHHAGTVFRMTPSGREKVLHSFGSGTDGIRPLASLIDVNGTLYGTTEYGGVYSCGSIGGCGTVFSITTGGTEKVLHSFGSGTDGRAPAAPLLEVNGTLYGTTLTGGSHSCGSYYRCGTVFSITPSGTEKVLHSFGSGSDGGFPTAGLTDMNGTLYGATSKGGKYDEGTVFALTP